ncbi:purine-cytosine permease family protein [Sciscionella marina]|uniref:purine-cytosine permease family protein n=1 Tax=Sciscionella marina TaxID=508770 RepID=UPI00036357FE|nr:cytosine permease [Sciscionella marina]
MTEATSEPSTVRSGGLVERRSIGVVPDAERHGRPVNQFTLWFGTNLQITTVVTGALAVVFGSGAFWAVLGLLIGNALGGAVMALHSAQGPKLGLPQMISSRAQFGVFGAAVPLVLVVLMYIGFFASGAVLAGQALASLLGAPDVLGIVLFAVITAVVTVIGYRLIHAVGRVASVVGALAFLYLVVRLCTSVDVPAILHPGGFDFPLFLLAISLAASWQLAFGPYVADYSRYLPRSTSARATFWWTFGGSVLGAQWAMSFGAVAAAAAGGAFTGHEVGYIVGLGGAGAMAGVLYFVIAFGKLTVSVLDGYGGFMTITTIISGFRGQREVSKFARATWISAIMAAGTVLALAGRGDFLDSFSTFLLFLLTFFTPWSAVNLVDYYLIAKERYDLPALSDPGGRYGRWRMPALTAYIIGVLAQLPFLSTAFYTGPLVEPLGGADISWIIGLVIPAVLYWVLTKRTGSAAPAETILPPG